MPSRSLRLDRPLISLDLETTGLDPERDRIVEISRVKSAPAGTRDVRTRRLHPGMPIPPAATAVHGITDADVADCPRFAQVARPLAAFLEGCDVTGFNVERFDLPMLAGEFRRAGVTYPTAGLRVVDSFRLYLRREPRDLASAVRFYCGREHEGLHSAEADAIAAADVLLAQLERYQDLPDDVDGLARAARPEPEPDWIDADGKLVWRSGEAAIGFGRHRDRLLRELAATQADYLRWILAQEFSIEVKEVVGRALRGEFPVPPAK